MNYIYVLLLHMKLEYNIIWLNDKSTLNERWKQGERMVSALRMVRANWAERNWGHGERKKNGKVERFRPEGLYFDCS